MFQVIGLLIVAWICWVVLKGILKGMSMATNSERNIEFAKETRYIAIEELGIPIDYYNQTILNREKWDYIRYYAETLKKYGNSPEAILIKSDIYEIDINKCSWSRLLAYGVADLYRGEKPYLEIVNKFEYSKSSLYENEEKDHSSFGKESCISETDTNLVSDKESQTEAKVVLEDIISEQRKARLERDGTYVMCPSCGLVKNTKIYLGKKFNTKCSECNKFYSAENNIINFKDLDSFEIGTLSIMHGEGLNKYRCPKCKKIKIIYFDVKPKKNTSTKCDKCFSFFKLSENIYSCCEKEKAPFEKIKQDASCKKVSSDGKGDRGGIINQIFDTYEVAIIHAKNNPGKAVKRNPGGSGFVLVDMDHDFSGPVSGHVGDNEFDDDEEIPF